MPGKDDAVTITIADEVWELKPPRGMKAFKMMPKVVRILSEWVWGAIQNGIPLDKMFLEGSEISITSLDGLKAIGFISQKIVENFGELALEIIPFLLQCKPAFLQDHGEPREILTALWTSLKFHAPYVFGSEVTDALKKSVTAGQVEEAEDQTDSKPSEA